MSSRPFFTLSALVLALAAATLLSSSVQAGGAKRPVVVELFTSQGSGACIPADANLAQLAARKDVIALSLPITYWDMLGWHDTLANDANTKRQKAYSAAMWRGGVYTPQMIVDGITDVVGNRESQVAGTIAARQADEATVPMSVFVAEKDIRVSIGSGDAQGSATVWFFRVTPQATVSITAGENAGKTVTYHNIVRDVHAVGVWKGQPLSLDLPRQDLLAGSRDSIAFVVQQGGYGRIVGAAMVENPTASRH